MPRYTVEITLDTERDAEDVAGYLDDLFRDAVRCEDVDGFIVQKVVENG